MARVRAKMRDVSPTITAEMERRVAMATGHLHAEITKTISKSGPPRSKPGEPPHVDTGALRQSLQPSGPIRDGNKIRGTVSTSSEYAPHLEYGTSKMEPRPFLRPTLAEQTEAIKHILRTGKRPA